MMDAFPRGFLACILAAAVVFACGWRGPLNSGAPVEFTDEGTTMQSGYTGQDPTIDMRRDGSRWLVTVYQGQQSSRGYSIHVERATTHGTALYLRARFEVPAPGLDPAASLTSPAHTIGLPFGPDSVVLYDQNDQERVTLLHHFESTHVP